MEQSTQILKKLEELKDELDYIKIHLIDIDAVLTEDDLEALEEAEKDSKERKTKRLI